MHPSFLIIDPNNFTDISTYVTLLLRFAINSISVILLVRFIYYPLHRQKDYLFTFILFNFIIFFICAFLSTSQIEMGLAFGLFAVFSMIRYRTITIPVKEMSYFFVCVAMSLLNALATVSYYYAILILVNIIILLLVLILDRYVSLVHENSKEIIYEKIELIKPQHQSRLLDDLKDRTGLPIHRVEIRNINFLRDVAVLQVFYYAKNIETSFPASFDENL